MVYRTKSAARLKPLTMSAIRLTTFASCCNQLKAKEAVSTISGIVCVTNPSYLANVKLLRLISVQIP